MTFTIIYTSHTHTHTEKKMGKMKSFLTDSQPGYVFFTVLLKFCLFSAWALAYKGSLKEKKERMQIEEYQEKIMGLYFLSKRVYFHWLTLSALFTS